MKKIIYSPILKFLAVILFCTSMVLGVLTATAGIEDFYKVTPNLYSFENDFSLIFFAKTERLMQSRVFFAKNRTPSVRF